MSQLRAPLVGLVVRFDDDTWQHKFGDFDEEGRKLHGPPDAMPPLPKSLTISWQNERGEARKLQANLPTNYIGKMPEKPGRLEVTIVREDSAMTLFREERK